MHLDHKHKKFFLIEGSLLVILGFLAIVWPNISTFAIEIAIGWLFLLGGVIQICKCFKMPKTGSNLLAFFIALFYVLFGILIILFPKQSAATLTLLLAILFFAQGIFQVLMAFRWKTAPFKIAIFLSGAIAIILAFLIWNKWPEDSSWAIGLIVGINLIFFGFSQIFTAKTLPKT